MGILATLRTRMKAEPGEPNVVVVDDDEFDALVAELKGLGIVLQDDGGSEKPMWLYGRMVVAPDGSPRSTRTPNPPAAAL